MDRVQARGYRIQTLLHAAPGCSPLSISRTVLKNSTRVAQTPRCLFGRRHDVNGPKYHSEVGIGEKIFLIPPQFLATSTNRYSGNHPNSWAVIQGIT